MGYFNNIRPLGLSYHLRHHHGYGHSTRQNDHACVRDDDDDGRGREQNGHENDRGRSKNHPRCGRGDANVPARVVSANLHRRQSQEAKLLTSTDAF